MVAVAQLVRASGCGPEGRMFKSCRLPHYGNKVEWSTSAKLVEIQKVHYFGNVY